MSNTCTYYRYEWSGQTCSVDGNKVRISDDYYNKYCKYDYNMRGCPRYKQYGPYQSSGCYLTTIVCDTLGMDDHVSYLEALRSFRDNVLQKNPNYKEILALYDVVGPAISCKLAHDSYKEQIATNLFNLGIKPICKLLSDNKQEEAIEFYKDMTDLLRRGYGIKATVSDEYLNTMDIRNAGHGKKLVKSI